MPPSSFKRDKKLIELEEKNIILSPLKIKMKGEIIRNTNFSIHIPVNVYDKPDVIGLEEVLELKRRFYTVKCLSATGTLLKVDPKVLNLLSNLI